ncbi:MAG: hypothetical protein AAB650_02415 [Patescibacteria group bacterium]
MTEVLMIREGAVFALKQTLEGHTDTFPKGTKVLVTHVDLEAETFHIIRRDEVEYEESSTHFVLEMGEAGDFLAN